MFNVGCWGIERAPVNSLCRHCRCNRCLLAGQCSVSVLLVLLYTEQNRATLQYSMNQQPVIWGPGQMQCNIYHLGNILTLTSLLARQKHDQSVVQPTKGVWGWCVKDITPLAQRVLLSPDSAHPLPCQLAHMITLLKLLTSQRHEKSQQFRHFRLRSKFHTSPCATGALLSMQIYCRLWRREKSAKQCLCEMSEIKMK